MGKQITKSLWAGRFAEYVQAKFGEFETVLEKQGEEYHSLTIFNPHIINRDIKICFDGYEASFYFSFQHGIFQYEDDEIEQLIDYIRNFVSNEYAAFKFFKDGKYAVSGSQRSKGIDLMTIEGVLKTFIPDLSGEQIEQRALTLCEILPDISYQEHKRKITNTADEVRKQHYEYLKKHEYKLGIEHWSGEADVYKHIYWNGTDFEILDITSGDIFKKG